MSIRLEASRFTSIAALAKEVGELLKDQGITVLVLADHSGLDLVCEELQRLLAPEDFIRVMFGDKLKVVELQSGCECDIPNAGLALTGDGTCRVCRKPA